MRHRLVCVVAGSIGAAFLQRLALEGIKPDLVVDALDMRQVTTAEIDRPFDTLVTIGSRAYISAGVRNLGEECVGYHPSLLPRHKGPNAVADTLKAGDRVCGGSLYILTEDWDAGEVLEWCEAEVPCGATSRSLWEEVLKPMGVMLTSHYVLARTTDRGLTGDIKRLSNTVRRGVE